MPAYAYCRYHGIVKVLDEDGERRSVPLCLIGPEDVNDDGTVSFPLTGECDYHVVDDLISTDGPDELVMGGIPEPDDEEEAPEGTQLRVGFLCAECERTWPTKDKIEEDGRLLCPECADD